MDKDELVLGKDILIDDGYLYANTDDESIEISWTDIHDTRVYQSLEWRSGPKPILHVCDKMPDGSYRLVDRNPDKLKKYMSRFWETGDPDICAMISKYRSGQFINAAAEEDLDEFREELEQASLY